LIHIRRRIIELAMRHAAILLLLALAGSCSAADQWLRIATPHFELYTDDSDKSGRDLVQYFEQVRGFFLKVSPVRLPDDVAVRLIVFKNKEEFQPYSPRATAGAYYTGNLRAEYIVMQDMTPESYRNAVHEYTHFIVRHSGLRIPVWLNEGWADVYSSMHPVKGGVAVGDLLPERMKLLEGVPWLDFETLTSVTVQSPIYNEGDRTGVFYGESWALAHMLFLAPDYKPNFAKFVTALHRGSTAAEACQIAFGKSSSEVFQDLRTYFARKKLYGAVFQATLGKAEAAPEQSVVPPLEARLALADLQVAIGHFDVAAQEYQALDKIQPDRPDVAQSLGYMALIKKDIPLTLQYFNKAYAAGNNDPRMCLALAQLEIATKQPPSRAIPILERALQVKPDFQEARLQLGLLRAADRQFESGIAELMSVQNITPERAPAVFLTLAYAYLETGDLERAGQNVETAKKWAHLPQETERLALLTEMIEARAKLPAPPRPGEKLQSVEGLVQAVNCGRDDNRLRLLAGERTLDFLLPDPKAIEFTYAGGKTLKIHCGPQQPSFKVKIEYAPVSVMEQGLAGVIRRLDY
jgi:tetratricopeptide (TPR) repeat protein